MNSSWDPFAGWSPDRLHLIEAFEQLLVGSNRNLNLISRASVADVRRRHIVHSLTLAFRGFPDGSNVVDWGTGGGLPGIPLAIRFPNVTFHLVDSTHKKMRALERIRAELGLTNVAVHAIRAEDWATPVEYAVSRGTASLARLWQWTEPILKPARTAVADAWRPGLIALKGGDLSGELAELERMHPTTVVEEISLQTMTGAANMGDKYLLSVGKFED